MSFFRKENGEVSLLIDIGNGSVTGSFVLFKTKDTPLFLYSLSLPFNITEKPDATRLLENMLTLLDTLLATSWKSGFTHTYWKGRKKQISKVLIAFSSPWFVSKTKHIELSKEKDFIISKSFLEDVISKEETIFLNELSAGNSDNKEEVFSVIEKGIVHSKVNGYTIDNTIGKKTRNFDAFLCLAATSKNVTDKVYDRLLKYSHVPRDSVFMHTFPLVSFTVIRDIHGTPESFVMMDITSEVTDLTLIDDGVIIASSSMPSGKNFIIRKIADSFSVSAEIASSMLNLYSAKRMGDKETEEVENVLRDVEKEWAIYLENALQELTPKMTLPGVVYLTLDSEVAEIYGQFLKLQKTDTTAVFRKNMEIRIITKETLADKYMSKISVPANQFIVLLAVFYDKIIRKA